MFKHILNLILLLMAISHTNIVFAQEPPIVYQTFIRDDFDRTNGGYISIINALTLTEIEKMDLPTSSVQTIVLAPDKKLAFMNANPFIDPKKGLIVVDLGTKKVVRNLFEDIGVYGLKLAPDGMLWVLLNETQEIAIVNPKDLSIASRISSLEGAPRDVIFGLDDRRAYVSLLNNNVFVFDYITKRSITAIRSLTKGDDRQLRPQQLELSPDGKILYIGSINGIFIADITSFPIKITSSLALPINSFGDFLLKASPDGKFLYIGEYLGADLYIYNIETKAIINFRTPGNRGIINGLTISPTNKLLYIIESYGISLYDIDTQSFITGIVTSTGAHPPNPFSKGIALTGDFSIGQAPKLQTISPVANDNFVAGQPVTIKWQTTVAAQSYAIASHSIELSTDSGATFAPIPGAEELPGNVQEFTWTTPNIEVMDKAQIRVSTVDLGARRANSTTGNFSIIKTAPGDTQAPTVTFLSPKGSERFNSGDNLQISWMSSDNVAVTSQDLSLSTDGGTTFPITIASGLPGATQSLSFLIPTSLQSDQARLRLIVRDGAGNSSQTVTPSTFRIEQPVDTLAPVVTISQPSSNQSLIAGQPIQVNWQSVDNRAVVSQALLLSLDGGKTFATVASFGASDNSFVINNIDRLNLTNSQAIVRITATDSSGNIGQASTQFSTSPAITNAVYQSKILTISGIGFMSNSASSTTRLFVNEKEITLTPMSVSNNSFAIKGSKKKLGGIVRGNNTVRLVVNGIESNNLTFNF
ncbi:MAG: YD repeat-/RHS repeat-containing protein [bacterium]|nr:MAG: YD repeat-/RHS repeat-containing protein [bacterium]